MNPDLFSGRCRLCPSHSSCRRVDNGEELSQANLQRRKKWMRCRMQLMRLERLNF